jgi:hypothetical protein
MVASQSTLTYMIDSSFNIQEQQANSTGIADAFADQIQTTITTRNPSWSGPGAGAVQAAAIAVFKPGP